MESNERSARKSQYYSIRRGTNSGAPRIDLPRLLKLFEPLFAYFENEGYFQEALGYHCVDAGFVSGYLGQDLEGAVLLELHKAHLTPIHQKIHQYSEDDLFDIVEFLYDHCAKPTSRSYHSWSNCGWHCDKFDVKAGQVEFLERLTKSSPSTRRASSFHRTGRFFTCRKLALRVCLRPPFQSTIQTTSNNALTLLATNFGDDRRRRMIGVTRFENLQTCLSSCVQS
jgi:hypothetical protein